MDDKQKNLEVTVKAKSEVSSRTNSYANLCEKHESSSSESCEHMQDLFDFKR